MILKCIIVIIIYNNTKLKLESRICFFFFFLHIIFSTTHLSQETHLSQVEL